MVDRLKEKRMNGYTRQERRELAKELNRVLDRCTDQRFGRAVAAAANAIRGGK